MTVRPGALGALYEGERARLNALCETEVPSGMHASPVFGQGPNKPYLVLIGEAPGAEETKAGRPFVGKAGKQLDELLQLAGIPRGDVFITNAVKYRPVTVSERSVRNRTPDKNEIMASLPLLREELLLLRPAYIATLGNVPLFAVLTLCGKGRGTIGELHGVPMDVTLGAMQATLFPLYHPAGVIYNRSLLPVCEADARALGRVCAVNKR
ncbi:MAG TPA: uracil-DNA glycosylase [Feifaniaceae bacterium]|nr:uracil-DNA glycosylase [Feifaniaceae bacterium]